MNFTTSDGISLHYTDEGSGPPVIALAGLTRNGTDFDHVALYLNCRLIIELIYLLMNSLEH